VTGSQVSTAVYVDADWRVDCYEYPARMPILTIYAGLSTVTLSVKDGEASGSSAEFARELAAKVARFAAEAGRIHAEQEARAANGTPP
jgi:hypothetical protein